MNITGARFPARYIQGPGLISQLGHEARSLGHHAFCLLDRALADQLTPVVHAAAGPLDVTCRAHGGECSEDEIKAGVIAAENADLVLVDTDLIAQAPTRFLAAGIGDALATFYEADSSRKAQAPNCWGTQGAGVAHAIAALCRDVIFADGEAALAACDVGRPDPAFERVVEANILLSGVGVESGGDAGAHAIHHGLCELPNVHGHLHGEKVALGVQAMLLIQGQDAEYARVRDFCNAVRLPVRLADVGITNASEEKSQMVAQRACKPDDIMGNEPMNVTPDMVVSVLKKLI